jgi:hypothetical protein
MWPGSNGMRAFYLDTPPRGTKRKSEEQLADWTDGSQARNELWEFAVEKRARDMDTAVFSALGPVMKDSHDSQDSLCGPTGLFRNVMHFLDDPYMDMEFGEYWNVISDWKRENALYVVMTPLITESLTNIIQVFLGHYPDPEHPDPGVARKIWMYRHIYRENIVTFEE